MAYWPAYLFLLLIALAVYILVKAIRIARLSPEARQKRLEELKAKQARFNAERAAAKNGNPHLDISIQYEDWREIVKQPDSLQAFEDSLTVMWAGDTKPIEFTYVDREGDRTRRTLKVEEVSFNDRGQFYLRGICLSRNERRTFKVDNITTKLKVGSNRYDFDEWCVEMLDILPSEGFPQAYFDARS